MIKRACDWKKKKKKLSSCDSEKLKFRFPPNEWSGEYTTEI